MAQTPYVSLIAENGKVTAVEGSPRPDNGVVIAGQSDYGLKGKTVTDAMNKCAAAGYEIFSTETNGAKITYRMKLKDRR